VSPRPMVLVVENSRNAGVRADHAVLVEQRQLALRFQHALDHEHHVRAAGVVFVEHQRDGRCSAQGRMPSRNSVICLPSFRTMASLPTRSMR
jgi:hypothetical protein